MRRLLSILGATSLVVPAVFAVNVALVAGTTCTPTGFYRDGINMTAALINPGSVTGEVDATGCNIGVYFGPGAKGTVRGADIHGANYFGVVNRQAQVTIVDSQIHDIGETPFNGAQHGIAVYFATVDTGSSTASAACTSGKTSGRIEGNDIYDYQKGGIVANCAGTTAHIKKNSILGLDVVPFIAQNGIQFGYDATGTAIGNSVDGNWYSGASWSSTGILLFQASGVVVQGNEVTDNQVGVAAESWCYLGVAGANRNQISHNTISGSDWGVSIGAWDGPFSGCDPSADDNKVVNNVISSAAGLEGVTIWVDDSGAYTPSANGNKVNANTITGFATPISDGGTDTKAHANKP